jgi:hypothetical protein
MNGFIYRGPLAPESPLFKGRDIELKNLTQLCMGEVRSYGILYGGRQTGKTSLLNQLEKRLRTPSVRVDFQLSPGSDSAQAYAYISHRVNMILGSKENPNIDNGPKLADFLCTRLSNSGLPKLVLLLEELGALPDKTREEIANLFRAVFTNRFDKSCPFLAKLVVIFAGNIELYNLASKDVSPLKNICDEIYLADLSQADARSLIAEGLSASRLPQEKINNISSIIYDQVEGQPYLTQRFGAFFQQNINNVDIQAILDKAKKAILVDDPLLHHLRRMITEYRLGDSLGSLLKSTIRFSRTDEEMVQLEVLGFAKEKNLSWNIRNPLIQEIVTDTLKKKPVKKSRNSVSSRKKTLRTVRVFVSSTWVDLQFEREFVEKALHRLIDTNFSGMEYFGSQEDTPLKVSLKAVDDSEIYIGIFAHRYGSGITEKEYRRARRNGLPCFIYFKDDDIPVKPAFIEQEAAARDKLTSLKNELKKNHLVSVFRTSEELAAKVTSDLHNYLHRR